MTNVRNKLIIFLSAAFIVRVALIVIFKTYLHPMPFEHEQLANNILSGKGFLYLFLNAPYRSFCNPLFSWLCAGVYFMTGHSHFAVLLMQSSASILLALAVFGIARMMFDERVALVSAAMVSFHPGFIYYDVFNLMPLSIDALFIASATYLFLKYKDRPDSIRMAIVGAVIGAGVMSRGIIGTLMPFFAIYMMTAVRSVNIKKRVAAAGLLAISTLIVIAPWIIRNYIIHREVMIISTTGETLWRGNNALALGTSLDKDGKAIIELWPEDFRKKVYAMDEIQQKKFFEKEAMRFIKDNPARFIELYLKKVYYYWWFSPQSGTLYPRSYLVVYRWMYSLLLVVFMVGLIKALSSRNISLRSSALLMVFVFMAICLIQSVYYVEGRHRWLIEPLMIIFFCYGADALYSLLSGSVKAMMTGGSA